MKKKKRYQKPIVQKIKLTPQEIIKVSSGGGGCCCGGQARLTPDVAEGLSCC